MPNCLECSTRHERHKEEEAFAGAHETERSWRRDAGYKLLSVLQCCVFGEVIHVPHNLQSNFWTAFDDDLMAAKLGLPDHFTLLNQSV